MKKIPRGRCKEVLVSFSVPWWLMYLIMQPFKTEWEPWYLRIPNLLVPAAFFFVIGMLINTRFPESSRRITVLKIAPPALFLVLLDEAIAWVIARNPDLSIPIVKGWLSITPYLHTNHFIATRVPLPEWYSLPLLPVALFVLYRFFFHLKKNTWLPAMGMIFVAAALVCLVIDRIVYGGTNDYIKFEHFAVADVHDIYIAIGGGCCFQYLLFYDPAPWGIKRLHVQDKYSVSIDDNGLVRQSDLSPNNSNKISIPNMEEEKHENMGKD